MALQQTLRAMFISNPWSNLYSRQHCSRPTSRVSPLSWRRCGMQQSMNAISSVLSTYAGLALTRLVQTEVQLGSMLHFVMQSGCFSMYCPKSSLIL
jgi:hypothetical protein